MHRRASRHQEAAEAWQGVLDLVPRGRSVLTALERQAVQALAIHHEHRARDLGRARGYAEALGASTSGRLKQETEKRLRRIERKMQTRHQGPGGPRVEKRWLIED
jgi:cytochrome c-type biogenesis protein CcmH/NrfG